MRGISTGSHWGRWVLIAFDPAEPAWLRCLPFTVVLTASAAVIPVVGLDVLTPGLVAAGVALAVALPLIAALVPWDRSPAPVGLVVPILQILALLLVQLGSDASTGLVAANMLVPIVVLAVDQGRRGAVVASIGALVVTATPLALDTHDVDPGLAAARCVLLPAITLAVALAISEVVDRLEQRRVELERANARLATTREWIVELVNAAPDQAVLGLDADGVVNLCNPGAERLLGRPAEEVIGRLHVDDLGPPETARLNLDAVPEHGEVQDAELMRPDGTVRHVRVWTFRSPGLRDDPVPGFMLMATDISYEVEAREMQRQFTGLVSHELRTPVTSILGYLDLLRGDDDNLTEDQRESLGVIERSARRLLLLVSDLLLAAQVDAGRFRISVAPVDLVGLARASVAAATPTAASRGITLAADLPARAEVLGDFARLGQALDNLLTNAIKYSDRGDTVTVVVTQDESARRTRVAVVDTGRGIAADELPRLTERFFRSEEPTVQERFGVGLGLSIVATIVSAHDGRMEIDSTLGEGSSFAVLLPTDGPAAGG
ncbi:PAS domain-containing protein [Nocardioides sp. GY 10113]|uniref:sensor histidine kinase n=1 Tax=Nocardioides sp. GY 10113 TaxID=2569761 RepID=UPI0010A7CB49|nr:ATP-binding protein [Nocardioides sp. GY 10113]TIC85069.1 PAS domain-containing protein [Nocardioides sp. GY 10113]